MSQIKVKNEDMMALVIEALGKNQQAIFKVTGSSMRPFFRHEETSVILEKPKAPLKKKDIILFSHNDQYILHRIIRITGDVILSQGDALLSKETVNLSSIIGIVRAYEHREKTIDINDPVYRLKVFVWLLIRPFILSIRRKRP